MFDVVECPGCQSWYSFNEKGKCVWCGYTLTKEDFEEFP